MNKELYFYFFSICLPWIVNSIPSPIATSSWLSSLALFLSLYASNSPSARSRSPSWSIPSAQSYKISNPPLLGNLYRKTNRNALKIIGNAVQIEIRSLYIQAHLIHTCAFVFRRDSQHERRIEESDHISNMIVLFACNRIWCHLCSVISLVTRSASWQCVNDLQCRCFVCDTCCIDTFDINFNGCETIKLGTFKLPYYHLNITRFEDMWKIFKNCLHNSILTKKIL